MPYLRLEASISQLKKAVRGMYKAYLDTVASGVYCSYHISTLLMYLFCLLEDVVAIHKRDFVKLHTKHRKADGRGDKGVLISGYDFYEYAKELGIASDGELYETLSDVIITRNNIAHSYWFACKPLDEILEHVSATDCLKLFKNAFNSLNLDAETKLICNKLLYALYNSNGKYIDKMFDQLVFVENAILEEEIKNAANNVSTS